MDKYTDIDGQILSVEIHSDGTKSYFNSKSQYHRLGGSAFEGINNAFCWYKEGKSHRIGGPAIYCFFLRPMYEWRINSRYVNIYYING